MAAGELTHDVLELVQTIVLAFIAWLQRRVAKNGIHIVPPPDHGG